MEHEALMGGEGFRRRRKHECESPNTGRNLGHKKIGGIADRTVVIDASQCSNKTVDSGEGPR